MVLIEEDEFREGSEEEQVAAIRRTGPELDEDTVRALTDLLSYLSNEWVLPYDLARVHVACLLPH